jgi:hypothetical protein
MLQSRSFLRDSLAAIIAGALLTPAVAGADPFLTRNQNPLLTLYGLPGVLPSRLARSGEARAAAVVNWTNAAASDEAGDREYTMDAEVQEFRVHLEHAAGEKFSIRGELAYRRVSGGTLDAFVEDFHDLFGLPDGPRSVMPRDELLIEYLDGGNSLLHIEEEGSGVADIPISAGYQLIATDERALAAWLTVKAPVGEVEELTGSGAMDVALSLSGDASLADRWKIFGQIDVTWLGEGDLLTELQEDFAWSALAGVTWNAWRGLDLTVQLNANSSVYDIPDLDLAGDAVLMTIGGSYRTEAGWQFDVGISEDIQVEASPDVVFNFALRHDF